MSDVVQCNVMWDRVVSCGSEQSHVENSNIIWDRLQGVQDRITFLKFDKSWNVLKASKYFSMIFKSLLDCQKVQIIFSEVYQVLECIESFRIFFYDF